MQWLVVCVLAAAVYGGGGVTQPSDPQFWTDYKIFDHVYGKIFDKDLYGDTLPQPVTFGAEDYQASDKKELFSYPKATQDFDPYIVHDKYNFPKKEKPATSTFNFLRYSGFNPISESSDPETYNYLKRLEEAEREKNLRPTIGLGGFKPYVNDAIDRPEETYAYKVIQNILDAHEANKGKDDDDDDENTKFLSYRENVIKEKRKPPRMVLEGSKQRCLYGKCRKRSSISSVRSRPYYRRVKYTIS